MSLKLHITNSAACGQLRANEGNQAESKQMSSQRALPTAVMCDFAKGAATFSNRKVAVGQLRDELHIIFIRKGRQERNSHSHNIRAQ